MSFFVNASQEEAFRLVMDYFTGRRMKILASKSPSYIKAEFGSWASISPSGSKGEVEINIVKRNGGSYVNLNFDFVKQYVVSLLFIAIGAVIIPIFYGMLEINFWLTLSVVFFMVITILAILGYSVSVMRRRFIEEFNMFIRSLASKKD